MQMTTRSMIVPHGTREPRPTLVLSSDAMLETKPIHGSAHNGLSEGITIAYGIFDMVYRCIEML